MAELPFTLGQLVSRVLRLLEDSPRPDALGASLTDVATAMTVTNPGLYAAAGTRAEIDYELVLSTTGVTNPITIVRGYENTTPTAHLNSAVIRVEPRFLKASIREALNVVINNWVSVYCPRFQWDSTTAGSFTSNRNIYAAPANAIQIRQVAFQEPGRQNLINVPHGPLMFYPTTFVSTGRGFKAWDFQPGRVVHQFFSSAWPFLEADSDTVPSDFPEMADDLLVTGAVLYLLGWRMVPKFRTDEITFYRESSSPVPAPYNAARIDRMRQDWIYGMQRVATHRAMGSSPVKVYR